MKKTGRSTETAHTALAEGESASRKVAVSTVCGFSLRLGMEGDGSEAKLLLHKEEDHSLRPRVDKTKTTPHQNPRAKQQETKQKQNLGKVACVYKPNTGEVETGGSLACWPTSPDKSANSRPMADPFHKIRQKK